MIKKLLAIVLFCLSFACFGASKDIEKEIGPAFERSEWTQKEKTAFTLSLIGHTLDLASSLRTGDGCVERNLVLGENPSNASLIGLKLLAIGVEYWIYNSPRFRHYDTHWYGYTSAVIHTGAAIGNFRNECQ